MVSVEQQMAMQISVAAVVTPNILRDRSSRVRGRAGKKVEMDRATSGSGSGIVCIRHPGPTVAVSELETTCEIIEINIEQSSG